MCLVQKQCWLKCKFCSRRDVSSYIISPWMALLLLILENFKYIQKKRERYKELPCTYYEAFIINNSYFISILTYVAAIPILKQTPNFSLFHL